MLAVCRNDRFEIAFTLACCGIRQLPPIKRPGSIRCPKWLEISNQWEQRLWFSAGLKRSQWDLRNWHYAGSAYLDGSIGGILTESPYPSTSSKPHRLHTLSRCYLIDWNVKIGKLAIVNRHCMLLSPKVLTHSFKYGNYCLKAVDRYRSVYQKSDILHIPDSL